MKMNTCRRTEQYAPLGRIIQREAAEEKPDDTSQCSAVHSHATINCVRHKKQSWSCVNADLVVTRATPLPMRGVLRGYALCFQDESQAVVSAGPRGFGPT